MMVIVGDVELMKTISEIASVTGFLDAISCCVDDKTGTLVAGYMFELMETNKKMLGWIESAHLRESQKKAFDIAGLNLEEQDDNQRA